MATLRRVYASQATPVASDGGAKCEISRLRVVAWLLLSVLVCSHTHYHFSS